MIPYNSSGDGTGIQALWGTEGIYRGRADESQAHANRVDSTSAWEVLPYRPPGHHYKGYYDLFISILKTNSIYNRYFTVVVNNYLFIDNKVFTV